jgi:hypothetical protein
MSLADLHTNGVQPLPSVERAREFDRMASRRWRGPEPSDQVVDAPF